MEENSESGHSGGRWRALPAHTERREGEEVVVREGEEEEEIREREGEKDSTVQEDLSTPDCSQPASPAASFSPLANWLLSPPSSLPSGLLSSSLALSCLLCCLSRMTHIKTPLPGLAGRRHVLRQRHRTGSGSLARSNGTGNMAQAKPGRDDELLMSSLGAI